VTSAAAAAGFWIASEAPLATAFSILAVIGVVGFIFSSGPVRAGLGLRLRWWLRRRRFRPQSGWRAVNAPRGLGASLVLRSDDPVVSERAFLCVVEGPSGQFVHDELPADGRLPQTGEHTRMLGFPADFEAQPPFPKPVSLSFGTYHVRWFAWRYDGVAVVPVALALDSFEVKGD
jgi:hypothetical protein